MHGNATESGDSLLGSRWGRYATRRVVVVARPWRGGAASNDGANQHVLDGLHVALLERAFHSRHDLVRLLRDNYGLKWSEDDDKKEKISDSV